MWVAEPCNRPWNEKYEVKPYQFARDRYWKEIGGPILGDVSSD